MIYSNFLFFLSTFLLPDYKGQLKGRKTDDEREKKQSSETSSHFKKVVNKTNKKDKIRKKNVLKTFQTK